MATSPLVLQISDPPCAGESNTYDLQPTLRLQLKDARRKEELIALCHFLSNCQICGRKLNDETLILTPGVCGFRRCRKSARRDRSIVSKKKRAPQPTAKETA